MNLVYFKKKKKKIFIYNFFYRYDEFLEDEAKIVPGAGENGAPVQLEGSEKIEADQRMATEAFNIIASDKISLHRAVPDTRDPR